MGKQRLFIQVLFLVLIRLSFAKATQPDWMGILRQFDVFMQPPQGI